MARKSSAVFPENLDPVDVAWVAGLFEGEGSISSGTKNGLVLSVRMTDLDVLQRLQSVMGGKVYGPYRPGKESSEHHKDVYQWVVRGREYFNQFAQAIGPSLGSRRQARIRLAMEDSNASAIALSI